MRKRSQRTHCSSCDQAIPGEKLEDIGNKVAAKQHEFKANNCDSAEISKQAKA